MTSLWRSLVRVKKATSSVQTMASHVIQFQATLGRIVNVTVRQLGGKYYLITHEPQPV